MIFDYLLTFYFHRSIICGKCGSSSHCAIFCSLQIPRYQVSTSASVPLLASLTLGPFSLRFLGWISHFKLNPYSSTTFEVFGKLFNSITALLLLLIKKLNVFLKEILREEFKNAKIEIKMQNCMTMFTLNNLTREKQREEKRKMI